MERIFGILAGPIGAVVVLGIVCMILGTSGCSQTETTSIDLQSYEPIIDKCKGDLANRLKVDIGDIKVVSKDPVNWPNSSLGLPKVGEMYLQVITPGLRLVLGRNDARYFYTASTKSYRYGGSPLLWKYSLLYMQPRINDPNLNSDLYQCSLLGTNSAPVLSEVSEYYPQPGGYIIAKRRTSRSFHDLIFANTKEKKDPIKLAAAVDFGGAAINDNGEKWAAYARPGLGRPWVIFIGSIAGSSDGVQSIDIPETFDFKDIAWLGDSLMILGEKPEGTACLRVTPSSDKLEWEGADVSDFPKSKTFILNKSQHLEVNQTKADDQPCVEIAVVWFTGNMDVTAKIKGLTLNDYDMIGDRFVIIWGKEKDQPATYIVDYETGEIVSKLTRAAAESKYFICPPMDNPFADLMPK